MKVKIAFTHQVRGTTSQPNLATFIKINSQTYALFTFVLGDSTPRMANGVDKV